MKHLFYLILLTTMLTAFIVSVWFDDSRITITAFFGAIIIALIKDWKTIIKIFD